MTRVTTFYLQMNTSSELRPKRSGDTRFTVRETAPARWQLNRDMYLLVGGEWDWVDKYEWSDRQWQDYAESDDLRTFIAHFEGDVAGYYELRRDEPNDVEIAYFGLTPAFFGRGLGAALLTDALERAWAWDAQRVWVHTCTLDHPAALKNYEARGMTVYQRTTEGSGGPAGDSSHGLVPK